METAEERRERVRSVLQKSDKAEGFLAYAQQAPMHVQKEVFEFLVQPPATTGAPAGGAGPRSNSVAALAQAGALFSIFMGETMKTVVIRDAAPPAVPGASASAAPQTLRDADLGQLGGGAE